MTEKEKETFRWFPDADHVRTVAPVTYSARFGDGIEQRGRKGITPILDSWALTFTGTRDQAQEIEDFLTRHGGCDAFHWKNPDENLKLYICRTWTKNRKRGVISSISATFEQVAWA